MNPIDFIPTDIPCSQEIREKIIEKINSFSMLSEDLPIFIIHELRSGEHQVVYMSPFGLQNLGISLEEVRSLRKEYYKIFFNGEDADHYLSKWDEFISDYSNKGVWFTFFQQVKIRDFPQHIWFLSASTVIAYDENKNPLFSITLAFPIHQYTPMQPKLERFIKENSYMKENMHLFASLTPKEKEVLKEMALGHSPKSIAKKLFSSENTIRTHRRNIKRKIKVKNDIELIYFAQSFNMMNKD